MSILLIALGGGGRVGRGGAARLPASGCGAGILAGLTSPASCASSRPIAVFSAAISTVRRSIRSGQAPESEYRARLRCRTTARSRACPERDLQSLAVDLLLQHDQAIQERLRRGRATGNIDIDRNILVDARNDVIAFFERPAAGGAGTHRDDVFGFGHLVVEPGDHRHHRLGDRARDDHQIGLPGRAAENLGAKPGDVEPARCRADHLDRAAGQPETQRPERRAPSPVVDRVDDPQKLVPVGDQNVLLELPLENRIDHRAPLGARDCRIRHDESSVSG